MRAGRTQHGFSLVELVMVLSIIAVTAAIALPRYSRATARYRIDLAARRVMADLYYAQTLARVTSAEVKVKFVKGDKPDESYYYFDEIVDPEHSGSIYTVVLRDDPYRVLIFDQSGDVIFQSDGSPKDTRTIILRIGSQHQRTITVDKLTANVTVQ